MQTTMNTTRTGPATAPRFATPAVPVCAKHVRRSRLATVAAATAPKEGLTYKAAGVDIDAGDELVDRIKRMNPGMNDGFSGFVPFGDSYLVSGTDGVGTKLKLAFDMNKHDTVSSSKHVDWFNVLI